MVYKKGEKTFLPFFDDKEINDVGKKSYYRFGYRQYFDGR